MAEGAGAAGAVYIAESGFGSAADVFGGGFTFLVVVGFVITVALVVFEGTDFL